MMLFDRIVIVTVCAGVAGFLANAFGESMSGTPGSGLVLGAIGAFAGAAAGHRIWKALARRGDR